jgi:acyl carrier protein
MSTQPNDTELTERLAAVFRQTFGKRLGFSTDLKRTDVAAWTSLKHVEFIIALESAFKVRFDGADATDMVSIPVVLERLRQKVA